MAVIYSSIITQLAADAKAVIFIFFKNTSRYLSKTKTNPGMKRNLSAYYNKVAYNNVFVCSDICSSMNLFVTAKKQPSH